jgi:flagellar protein FliO/FliZ
MMCRTPQALVLTLRWLLLLVPITAHAATPSAPAPGSALPLGMGELGQVTGSLLLVLLLIGALAWGAQRLRLAKGSTGRHLRVVDALSLGTRERLLLVEVDGERLLLGVAGGQLRRLHVLSAPTHPEFASALHAATHAGRVEIPTP